MFASKTPMSKGKKIFVWSLSILGLLLLAAVAFVGGKALRLIQKGHGEKGGAVGIAQAARDWQQIIGNPRAGFPGQERVNILCMGIDDNWTDTDQVYTKGARTDTLFLLSLDLNNHKAAMLSIPRDTYTHIAGTRNRSFKINEAYETGGPQRAIDTVYGLLGVQADHYLVLNIDSTKKMVDALGGVDVNVEHPMDYDDDWGHLHIHLQPGFQHLNGDEAVGFARFRHARKGLTPEDGDERRSYRQHVLLRGMIAQGKSFANATQAPRLMDVAMSTVRTDLSRTQLLDLAFIFRGVQPEDIRTATLPGEDFRGTDVNHAWFYRLYPDKAKAYVDWLIRGNETASRRLVPIVVENGTATPGLAQRVVTQLKTFGYTDVRNGGNATPRTGKKLHLTAAKTDAPSTFERTALLDTGVPDPQAARDVASLLGLPDASLARRPLKPNRLGWTPDPTLTVILGQDYAQAVKAVGADPAVSPQPASTQTD